MIKVFFVAVANRAMSINFLSILFHYCVRMALRTFQLIFCIDLTIFLGNFYCISYSDDLLVIYNPENYRSLSYILLKAV